MHYILYTYPPTCELLLMSQNTAMNNCTITFNKKDVTTQFIADSKQGILSIKEMNCSYVLWYPMKLPR